MKRIELSSLSDEDAISRGCDGPSHDFPRQVDWERLKEIILNDPSIVLVNAGLAEDWVATSGTVFLDGEFIQQEDTYVHAASHWATPAVKIMHSDGRTDVFECWIEGHDSGSYFEEE